MKAGSVITQVKKEDGSKVVSEKKKEYVKTDTRLIPMWVWWLLTIGIVIYVVFRLNKDYY